MNPPSKDNFEISVIFSLFGQTYCESESLHNALCLLYMHLGFKKREHGTMERAEEKMRHAISLTLGKLIDEAGFLVPELKSELKIANEKRNYLAHRFWFEKIPVLYSSKGRATLRAELEENYSTFLNLNNKLRLIFQKETEKMGMNSKTMEEAMQKLISGDNSDIAFLNEDRKIEKKETIVKAWKTEIIKEEAHMVIFETDKGIFLQLSDVGLCLSKYRSKGENWSEHQISNHLPAVMPTKPKTRGSWDYDLNLKGKDILRVGFDDTKRRCILTVLKFYPSKQVHPE